MAPAAATRHHSPATRASLTCEEEDQQVFIWNLSQARIVQVSSEGVLHIERHLAGNTAQ